MIEGGGGGDGDVVQVAEEEAVDDDGGDLPEDDEEDKEEGGFGECLFGTFLGRFYLMLLVCEHVFSNVTVGLRFIL